MAESMISIPELPELSFDEIPHLYRLDGDVIPSVSKIMEPLSKAKYEGIPEKVLERAADRGSTVHNAIENWLKFGFVDIPSEYRGYMDAFLDWWDKMKPEAVGSEVRTYHKLMRYAGTLDLLCNIGGRLVLVDYKTTSKVSEMTCGVQLEAYAQALKSHGICAEEKRIFQPKKDGTWKEYIFPINDVKCWGVFGACKRLYEYIESYN